MALEETDRAIVEMLGRHTEPGRVTTLPSNGWFGCVARLRGAKGHDGAKGHGGAKALGGAKGQATSAITTAIGQSPRATCTRRAGLVGRGRTREVGSSPRDLHRRYFLTDRDRP